MRKYKKLQISKESHKGIERQWDKGPEWDKGTEYQPPACMLLIVDSTLGLRVKVLNNVLNF